MSYLALPLLSSLRIIVGTAAFAFPRTSLTLAQHPAPASSLLLNRLWASRDAALGLLLWNGISQPAGTEAEKAKRRAMVKSALLAGAFVDGLDVLSVVVAGMEGSAGKVMVGLLGGGAVGFLVLAFVGLRGLRTEQMAVGGVGK